jgi:octopine/nopaline transport system permease protein
MDNIAFGPNGWALELLRGAAMTILLSASAFIIGIMLGTLIALAKLTKSKSLRLLASLYVAVFRGLPELLIIFLFFFGTAAAVTKIASVFGYAGFVDINAFLLGVIAMSTIVAAYASAIVQSATLAIPKGQIEAALAFGMSPWQTFRYVRFKQLIRFALPDLGNLWLGTTKDTAVVSVTGFAELARIADQAAGATHQPFPIFLLAALLYLVITAGSQILSLRAQLALKW